MAQGKWVSRRWEYPPEQLFNDAAVAVAACEWTVKERDDAQRNGDSIADGWTEICAYGTATPPRVGSPSSSA